jgi:steroid 5-alpha reductase family enzyme
MPPRARVLNCASSDARQVDEPFALFRSATGIDAAPHYFFESMVWWGFLIDALDYSHGWIRVICPLLMLYILLKVAGIPLTEKHSLESRGDLSREYQRTTSRFVPWFRKTA